MITKKEMIPPILKVSSDFKSTWDEFLDTWKEEENLPIYLVLSELAKHIEQLHTRGDKEKIQKIFLIIEEWCLKGDTYVKEAATIGLLEDLQNTNFVDKNLPKSLAVYLLPETKYWWNKVNHFWAKGEIINTH